MRAALCALWVGALAALLVACLAVEHGRETSPVLRQETNEDSPREVDDDKPARSSTSAPSASANETSSEPKSSASKPKDASEPSTATTAAEKKDDKKTGKDDTPAKSEDAKDGESKSKGKPSAGGGKTSNTSSTDEDKKNAKSNDESGDERDFKYPRLSPGLIIAIAFGAVAATAIPLLLCCLCGCVSCIKVDWTNNKEAPGRDPALARSGSRKSTIDCRHSECGSFHISVDSDEQDQIV